MGELDGGMWVSLACWFALWAVLMVTGFILTQREKQRGGPR